MFKKKMKDKAVAYLEEIPEVKFRLHDGLKVSASISQYSNGNGTLNLRLGCGEWPLENITLEHAEFAYRAAVKFFLGFGADSTVTFGRAEVHVLKGGKENV